MEREKLMLNGLLVAVLGLGLMLAGCAKINQEEDSGQMDASLTAAAPSPEDMQPPPFDLTRYDYPEAADYPPEGYQFVPIGANFSRGCDDYDDWEFGIVWVWWGGDVFLDDSETGIVVGPYGIPRWAAWIAVTRPYEDEPWVQFEPHGLVFTESQTARISWAECGLPDGMDPEDFTVWYFHEEINEYEYMGGVVYPEEQYVEYDIDHFSRYVIASKN